MQKIAENRHLEDDVRASFASQVVSTEARVIKLLGGEPGVADPLAPFKPQIRRAYEHIIELIYDCVANRVAAKALVDKILAKLEEEAKSEAAKGNGRQNVKHEARSKQKKRR
jgi:hypothetical protein